MDTFPKLNAPLLLATLSQIQADPTNWHQGTWTARSVLRRIRYRVSQFLFENGKPVERRTMKCGTACCFAGWAVTLEEGLDRPYTDAEAGGYFFNGETGVSIAERAREYLGLTEKEADNLFSGANTLPDLENTVQDLIATRG